MEDATSQQSRRKKSIFKIETKREYEKKVDQDGNEYITDNYTSWTINHELDVLSPSAISEQTEDIISFADQVKEEFEKLFDKRHSNLTEGQLNFCYDAALSILGDAKDRSKITVIPARAGFGKSSFIFSFLSVFCDYVTINFLELIKEQGVIIVTDKLNALRSLDQMIFDAKGYFDDETKTRFTYLLEAWNKDSYVSGVCLDEDITEFTEGMCSESCSFYYKCKMSKQKFEQKFSPILLITNARFYQHFDKIAEYATWIDADGKERKRDIIIIDEKPNMVYNGKIDSKSFASLIEIAENSVNSEIEESLKQEFIDSIKRVEEKFIELRKRLSIYRNCIYPRNNQVAFNEDFVQKWKSKIGRKGLNTIIDINTLFSDGALWCRTKIPYFSVLGNRIPYYENFKTFIFDATAELDPDYMKKDRFQFLDINCYKDYKNITVHTFYNEKLNMSRSALKGSNNWKIKAITNWLNNNMAVSLPKVYAISYGFCVKQISKGLDELNTLYCLDSGSSRPVIPHFGDTRGSNDFMDAYTMIQLGWNRISSDVYLKNTLCLWCDIDKVLEPAEDKEERTAKLFEMKNGFFKIYNSPNEYMWMRLAADFEQEIFRTAVRDFSANKPVDIFVFYPSPKVIELIKQRLNCTIKNHNDELPLEFDITKITERNNSENTGEKNKIQKFIEWLERWDGKDISINKIKEKFKFSESYWKKINRMDVITKIKLSRKIQRKRLGKGVEQEIFWYIEEQI